MRGGCYTRDEHESIDWVCAGEYSVNFEKSYDSKMEIRYPTWYQT